MPPLFLPKNRGSAAFGRLACFKLYQPRRGESGSVRDAKIAARSLRSLAGREPSMGRMLQLGFRYASARLPPPSFFGAEQDDLAE